MNRTRLSQIISCHDVASYLFFVFGIGWFFYILGALIVYGHPERFQWLYLLQPLGAAMALVGGLVVRQARGGREEVNNGWRQYQLWRQPVWLYLFSIALLPFLAVVSALSEGNFHEVSIWNRSGWSILPYLPVVFIAQLPGSPLLEEYGWRGFLQQRLQEKFSVLISALIVGTLWGVHHLPIAIATGGPIMETVLGAVIASVIFAWLLNASRGSMFLVLLLHASLNIAMMMAANGYVFYLLTGAVALTLVATQRAGAASRRWPSECCPGK